VTDKPTIDGMDSVELVKGFLKAQNLEQVARVDEAIPLYEECVAASFDASGPYDRLIALYSDRALHDDVMRVATSALANVQTHDAKREWYARMREEARRAAARVPTAAKKRT
jgi:hypothetical protein